MANNWKTIPNRKSSFVFAPTRGRGDTSAVLRFFVAMFAALHFWLVRPSSRLHAAFARYRRKSWRKPKFQFQLELYAPALLRVTATGAHAQYRSM
jgi:hypothetical protein